MRRMLAALAGASIALGACGFETRSEEFACDTDDECGGDRICSSGWCVEGDTIDPNCPEPCTSCTDSSCTVNCGLVSCSGTVACPEGYEACIILCSPGGSCSGGVECGGAPDCNIDCSGRDSCAGPITCGSGACDVECGRDACSGGVLCASGPCDIACDAPGSCAGQIDCSSACSCQTSCHPSACAGGAACPGGAACTAGQECRSAGETCDTC